MLLEVGRIAKPHGLRGEVVVELTSTVAERLAPGSRLESDRGLLEVVSSRPHQGRHLVVFAGFGSREGAEGLRNVVLRAEPVEDPSQLWVHELIGSEVAETDGTARGTVTEVQANPASDLLVLDDGALVPLTFVVSHGDGRVVIDPPVGLFD